MTLLLGPERLAFAVTFGAMAFSTFVFDTLDVSTRLGRYLLQELFGWRGKLGAAVATAATIAPALYFVVAGGKGAWTRFWTLFGASNQLLAALTLISITVWLCAPNPDRGSPKAAAPINVNSTSRRVVMNAILTRLAPAPRE